LISNKILEISSNNKKEEQNEIKIIKERKSNYVYELEIMT